jgi:hypothetical protein
MLTNRTVGARYSRICDRLGDWAAYELLKSEGCADRGGLKEIREKRTWVWVIFF